MKNAFEGLAPDLTIAPALVKLSHGELPLPGNIKAAPIDSTNIQFSWDTSDITFENRYNQVMLLAYDIQNGYAHMRLAGELRKAGSDILTVRHPKGKTFHLHIAFVTADRSARTDSLYLGAVTL